MIVQRTASLFSNFTDDVVSKVNDSKSTDNNFSLKDCFVTAISSVSNGRYKEFTDTRDYAWDKDFPSLSTLKAKGATLQAYVRQNLCLYLSFLLAIFEAQIELCKADQIQTQDSQGNYPSGTYPVQTVKYAYASYLLRTLYLSAFEKSDKDKVKNFIQYIDDINKDMAEPNPDYSRLARYYNDAVITVAGVTSRNVVSLDSVEIKDPKLKKLAKVKEEEEKKKHQTWIDHTKDIFLDNWLIILFVFAAIIGIVLGIIFGLSWH